MDKIVILLTTVAEIWHRINSTLGVIDDIQKLRQQPAKLGSLENGCPTVTVEITREKQLPNFSHHIQTGLKKCKKKLLHSSSLFQ